MQKMRGELVRGRRHAHRLRQPGGALAAQGAAARPRRLRHQLRPQPGRRRHLLRDGERDLRRDPARHPVGRLQPGDRRGLSRSSARPASPPAASRELLEPELPEPTCCSTSICPAAAPTGLSLHAARRGASTSRSVVEKERPARGASTTGSPARRSGRRSPAPTTRRSPPACVSVTPLHLDLTDYRGLEEQAGLRRRLEPERWSRPRRGTFADAFSARADGARAHRGARRHATRGCSRRCARCRATSSCATILRTRPTATTRCRSATRRRSRSPTSWRA